MSHTYKNLVLSQLYMLVFLFLFSQSLFNVDLYRSFGFYNEPVCGRESERGEWGRESEARTEKGERNAGENIYVEQALIGLTLFSYVYGPVDHVFSFLMHMLSRHFEYLTFSFHTISSSITSLSKKRYQADEYAVKLGYDLTEPLAKLSTSNKSSVIIDPLFSAYHHTHPTLLERIDNIAVLKKKYQN
jgi:STE24 endopeptidase